MMKQTVFLVGATGETGRSILDALIQDGSFDITCFIRQSSANKPEVQQLRDRNLKVVLGDLASNVENLSKLVRGIDTIVCAIFPQSIEAQIPLIDAAVQSGVKRFVPCGWAIPAARGGIMELRDRKEEVHDYIFRKRLGFTIIDLGFWYQMSFPRVPSGKFDCATFMPINDLFAGGAAPNMLIDKSDVGKFTARVIKDRQTLNKRVFACGEVLSQNEIHEMIEAKTGEKLEISSVSAEEVQERLEVAKRAVQANPGDSTERVRQYVAEYALSKYVRADNTPENAEYLGYVDGRDLYPDFKFIKFEGFVNELIAGNIERPYPSLQL